MGGCVGTSRDGALHSAESSDISGTVGHNKPLKQRKPKWKSDVRLTEAQLQAKRDEFWDTAPAFEGRREIWDALKASSCALEAGDHQLAQAILDGANISLPNGTLLECYDELGSRYQLPVYVLSAPINLLREGCGDIDSGVAASDDPSSTSPPGVEVPIRLHLSTGKDFKLTVRSTDTVLSVKSQVCALEGVEPSRQRVFFSGRQLNDRLRVEDAKIHKGYTLQVIVADTPPAQPASLPPPSSGPQPASLPPASLPPPFAVLQPASLSPPSSTPQPASLPPPSSGSQPASLPPPVSSTVPVSLKAGSVAASDPVVSSLATNAVDQSGAVDLTPGVVRTLCHATAPVPTPCVPAPVCQ